MIDPYNQPVLTDGWVSMRALRVLDPPERVALGHSAQTLMGRLAAEVIR